MVIVLGLGRMARGWHMLAAASTAGTMHGLLWPWLISRGDTIQRITNRAIGF